LSLFPCCRIVMGCQYLPITVYIHGSRFLMWVVICLMHDKSFLSTLVSKNSSICGPYLAVIPCVYTAIMIAGEHIFDGVPLSCTAAVIKDCRSRLLDGILPLKCQQWSTLHSYNKCTGGLEGQLARRQGYILVGGVPGLPRHRGDPELATNEWKRIQQFKSKVKCTGSCGAYCGLTITYNFELNSKCVWCAVRV
jgi:hypothetical protein